MSTSSTALIPLGMFILGVALAAGGFFPEALKAKRLLSGLVLNSDGHTEK